MAEIQTADSSLNNTTQHFIEFVMMQAQQAMLFLGRLPHPSTGETTVNLEAARMFIDYLEMLREKTKGNLSGDEEKILGSILAELQMSFVQVSNTTSEPQIVSNSASSTAEASSGSEETSASDEEQKKRFSKSYGS